MATNTDHIKLTKRYASALFELSVERKQQDAVASDLATLGKTLSGSATLTTTLNNPTLSANELAGVAAAIAEKAKLADITSGFLAMLAANKRITLLPSIITQFDALLRASKGESVVSITSAKKLSKEDKDALAGRIGKNVTINDEVDTSLLAGFVLQSGSRMLDASLKGKLDRMRVHLIAN